jgi:hypothetical protein
MNELVATSYTPRLLAARERFATGAARRLLDPELDPVLFELFLINYCSRGVRMTEPVESWIFGAGKRCREVGLEKLGVALQKHAEHEANHHLMMIADTKELVARWNKAQSKQLDADALLGVPESPAVGAYVKLHEDVIASSEPYRQLAIEFEIERISVTLGPPLMLQCTRLLGPSINSALSFLVEHVEIDQGHTKFNESQLNKLLGEAPAFALPLAQTGSLALDIYGSFLAECLDVATSMHAGLSRKPQLDEQVYLVQA